MIADLRFALRQFFKAPGYTAGVVAVLALGIGATTMTFSLVDAVLFRSLPVADPGRLIDVDQTNLKGKAVAGAYGISYVDFQDWRRRQRTLEKIALYQDGSFAAEAEGGAEALQAGVVSAGFFETLGVGPMLGRTFRLEEESLNGPRVVVLSQALWQRRFRGDAAVLGRSLRLNGESYQVIGVMPAGFRFPDDEEVWVPIRASRAEAERSHRSFAGVGRLLPGVSFEQARQDLSGIQAQLAATYASDAEIGIKARWFTTALTASYRPVVLTLFAAVLCLLSITCVNLASLGLARGAFRAREMAVRTALGAGRGRIVRQLLVENLALGLVGGAAGVFLAMWGVHLLQRLLVDQVPFWMKFTLDGGVLAFAAGLSVGASVAFGLAPALRLARTDVRDALQAGGRAGTAGIPRSLRWLLGAELALAVVLLAGAGLLEKSFLRLAAASPGFDARNLLTFSVRLPAASYPTDEAVRRAQARLVDKVAALPGVTEAALTSDLPLTDNTWGRGITWEDRPPPKPGETPVVLNRVVSPDYFRAMNIPVLAGRTFAKSDTFEAPHVVVVDEAVVREYFPHQNPVGQRLHYGRADHPSPWMEVIGVVGTVRHQALEETGADPGIYVPLAQEAAAYGASLVMKTAGPPQALAAAARRAVAEFDGGLAVQDLQPMSAWVDAALWRSRLVSEILLGFGAMALVLSALGVYAITAFVTTQRTRELGVRLALGASPADVRRLILGGGARLALMALPVGLVAALISGQVIAAMLYQVDPRDPAVLVGVALLLTAVILIASWIPARHAMRIDPMIALRNE